MATEPDNQAAAAAAVEETRVALLKSPTAELIRRNRVNLISLGAEKLPPTTVLVDDGQIAYLKDVPRKPVKEGEPEPPDASFFWRDSYEGGSS